MHISRCTVICAADLETVIHVIALTGTIGPPRRRVARLASSHRRALWWLLPLFELPTEVGILPLPARMMREVLKSHDGRTAYSALRNRKEGPFVRQGIQP